MKIFSQVDEVLKVKNYWFSHWMNLEYFAIQIENYSSRLRRAEERELDKKNTNKSLRRRSRVWRLKRSNKFYLFIISILIINCNAHDLLLLILKHFKLHLMKRLKEMTKTLILLHKFLMFRTYFVCVQFMSHLSLVFTWFLFRLCFLVMFRSLSYVFFMFSLFLVDHMFPYFYIINDVPFYYVFFSLSLSLLLVFYFLFYYSF